MSSIIIEGEALKLYPLGKPGFSGGTETYARTLAHGLAERGYTVHVVAPDLDMEEQRGEREWWWGPGAHPMKTDYWIGFHSLEHVVDYTAQHFILAPNGIDPPLGQPEWAQRLSMVACFSECHIDLLTATRPTISRDICKMTGLGVNIEDYPFEHYAPDHWHSQIIEEQSHGTFKTPHRKGRLLFANDPARGLWHLLPIFDAIRSEMPDAELRIAYDFDRQFEAYRWQATAMAERMWECKERIERGDGIVNLGNLSREALVAEQLACDLHIMPSDPPNAGSQIHGLTQMEMAAAGVPLLLSDIEAFPEVFGEIATLLPLPGTLARAGDDELARIEPEDWAAEALAIMRDRDRWQAASEAGRALAAKNDWSAVIDRWDEALQELPLD